MSLHCCDCGHLDVAASYEPAWDMCRLLDVTVKHANKQGCTEGKPKPKMLSINGQLFPAPVQGDGDAHLRIGLFSLGKNTSSVDLYHANIKDAKAMYNAIVKACGGE